MYKLRATSDIVANELHLSLLHRCLSVSATDQEFAHLASSYTSTLRVAVREPKVSCTSESITIKILETNQYTAVMVSTEHIMEVTSPCAVEISQLPEIGTPMVPLLGDQLYSTGLTAMNVDDPTQTFTCGVSICVADRPQFKTFPLDTDITTNDSRDSQVLGIPTSTCYVGVQDRCAETIIEHTDSSFEETDACGVWLVRRLWTVTSQGTCDNLSASRPQLISIKDTSPPVWTFQPPDVLVDFLAPYGPDATGFATTVDGLENTEDFADLISYPIQIWYQDDITHDPNSCETLAVVSRTWTTEDACGNRAVYVQSISIRHPRASLDAPLFGIASGFHMYAGMDLNIHESTVGGDIAAGGQPHIHEVVMHHETCASGSGYSVVAQKCPKLDNVDTGNGMHEVKCPKLRSCRKTDPFDFCDQTNAYGLGASTSQLDRFEFNFTEANAVLVASSHKIETLTMNSVDLRARPIIVNCTNPSLCQALKYNIISSIFGLVGSDLLYLLCYHRP